MQDLASKLGLTVVTVERDKLTDEFLEVLLKVLTKHQQVDESCDNFYKWDLKDFTIKDALEMIERDELLTIDDEFSDHHGKAPYDFTDGYLYHGRPCGEFTSVLIKDDFVYVISNKKTVS